VEGRLGALGQGASGDQGAGQGQHRPALADPAQQFRDRGGTELGPHDQDPDQQQHRRHAGHQQRHQRRQPGLPMLAVEPDQVVGRDRGEVPEHEQHQQVLGGRQPHHGHHEQHHQGVEAAPLGLGPPLVLQVPGHIGGGVGEHGDPDPGGQDRIEGAEAVQPERQPSIPARQPGGVEAATPATPQPKHSGEGDRRRDHRGDPSHLGGLSAAGGGTFAHPASL